MMVCLVTGRGVAQSAYVAPTPETIFSDTEERQGNPPAHLVYVLNRSTVPVTVFSVSLTNCQNIKGRCEPKRVNLRVRPGGRMMALRIEPANAFMPFGYHFGFSWRADSSNAMAVAALASAGDPSAREQLAGQQRLDSVRRTETGPQYTELTRNDFKALAGRARSLRAVPETLEVTPGERSSLQRVRLLVVDSVGQVLGQTHWIRWSWTRSRTIEFQADGQFIASGPGRTAVRFALAEEAQQSLGLGMETVSVAVIAAYPPDPHAPWFVGEALDADTKRPLACTRVALEDSALNVVVNDMTGPTGTFSLQAPRPGTYRVRLDTKGWAPTYGALVLANADEEKQSKYLVRFTEQLLESAPDPDPMAFQHAAPAAVTSQVIGQPSPAGATVPIIQGVVLGGSPSMPILGIISRVPPATVWAQFVVDSVGRVDTASIILPPETSKNVRFNVAAVLPRVRFSPARDRGRSVCEMLRMQINFSQR